MPGRSRLGWWWLVGYMIVIAAVVGSLFATRVSVLQQMATPQARADWQAWKQDAREQPANLGPVERREPKSDQPPMLILMRDYFAVMIAGAVTAMSLLYGFFAFTISGVWRSSSMRKQGAR